MSHPNPDDDLFFDSLEFFYEENEVMEDKIEEVEQILDSSSSSTVSELTKSAPTQKPISTFRRRRSSRFPKNSIPDESHENTTVQLSSSNENLEISQASSSAITNDTSEAAQDLSFSRSSREEALERRNGSLLFMVAGFLIKLVFFQLNLLVGCLKIPVKLLQYSILMVCDPFGTVKRIFKVVKTRFLCVLNWMYSNPKFGKQVVRLGFGCFWFIFVGTILVGFLVTAFLGGSLIMKKIVEEPLQIVEDLNFDYTKSSPDAFVSLDSRSGDNCNFISGEKGRNEMQVKSVNQKLHLIIALTLPESDYNRRLGMFQVRAEFLSADGKVKHSSTKPCMLKFKSPPIRFAETFIRTGTLLAGYSSESQVIKLKLTGSIGPKDPIACVRIIIEQRAEYKPSAGIPEIYAASLKLEFQLPLWKRILWNWRKTIFVWLGMSLFFLELLIALICCSPIIIPRFGLRQSTGGTGPLI